MLLRSWKRNCKSTKNSQNIWDWPYSAKITVSSSTSSEEMHHRLKLPWFLRIIADSSELSSISSMENSSTRRLHERMATILQRFWREIRMRLHQNIASKSSTMTETSVTVKRRPMRSRPNEKSLPGRGSKSVEKNLTEKIESLLQQIEIDLTDSTTELVKLQNSLTRSKDIGVNSSNERYALVQRKFDRLGKFYRQHDHIIQAGLSSLQNLIKLESEASKLSLPLDHRVIKMISGINLDLDIIAGGLRSILSYDDDTIQKILHACKSWPLSSDPFLYSTASETQKDKLEKYIMQIDCSREDSLRNVLPTFREDLMKIPLHSWMHSTALLALVSTMPYLKEYVSNDAKPQLSRYLLCMRQQHPTKELSCVIMIVFARLSSDIVFQRTCLKFVNLSDLHRFLTDKEVQLLSQADYTPVTLESNEERNPLLLKWQSLKQLPGAVPSKAIDDLFQMIGLKSVKDKILEVYESTILENSLPKECQVPQSHNFILYGNPGTGKLLWRNY